MSEAPRSPSCACSATTASTSPAGPRPRSRAAARARRSRAASTRSGSATGRSSRVRARSLQIGLAVRERSPADVTLYAGYTNGCISYIPAASEYPLGGYEPAYGNKTYGLPVQVAPDCDRLLVETGSRLVRSLFPERPLPPPSDFLASGALPSSPAPRRLERPPAAGR